MHFYYSKIVAKNQHMNKKLEDQNEWQKIEFWIFLLWLIFDSVSQRKRNIPDHLKDTKLWSIHCVYLIVDVYFCTKIVWTCLTGLLYIILMKWQQRAKEKKEK